jgi:hypothetical protein
MTTLIIRTPHNAISSTIQPPPGAPASCGPNNRPSWPKVLGIVEDKNTSVAASRRRHGQLLSFQEIERLKKGVIP